MKKKIYDHSVNYVATVVKLPALQDVTGLDNLKKATVFGNDCLVSKESLPTENYLFFPSGTQLSQVFLFKNNLFRESQLNSDISKKGYFDENGRVKAVKFKGVTSTGFLIPVSSLAFDGGTIDLEVGDTFNELEGVEICRKYVPVGTSSTLTGVKGDRVNKINNQLADLMIPNQFRFHRDTPHLANNLSKLQMSDIVVITDKWHGSSCILSKVMINKKLSWFERLVNRITKIIPSQEYAYIYSSGKPKSNLPKGIEGSWTNKGQDFYEGSNIWKRAFNDHKEAIEPGISLYGELVGYTESGQAIQKGYDYGCCRADDYLNGVYNFVVYRITHTTPEGNVIEFTWDQIKNYCTKYGLQHVKQWFHGSLTELIHTIGIDWGFEPGATDEKSNVEKLLEKLQTSYSLEKLCTYCVNKVPAEGIVLRIDSADTFTAFKLKSKAFLKKESDDLDKGETNIEDQQ